MGQYIFTPPAITRTTPFDFATLDAYIRKGRSLDGWFWARKIGTTLTMIRVNDTTIRVKLYATVIATLQSNGDVHISEEINDHQSHATTHWVQKVLSDNGFGGLVGRSNFAYPQAGQTFRVADLASDAN